MRRTWLAAFCLPLLVFVAPAVGAGDKPVDTPSVVVRVKSLDALLQNLNLVVKLIGQEDAARQIEAAIKSKVGKKGIEGIDPARPIGAYVRFGKEIDDLNGAILIPIADEKTFLTLLDNFDLAYKKDKDGIYTHKTTKNVDVYFRFAHKYLYVTSVNTESIQDKNLPDPAKALAVSGDATISILARVDQIPDAAKLIALFNLEESIQAAKKEGPPNETATQKAFRAALLDDVHKMTKSVINQAADVRFDLDVSDKTKELAVNVSITGKPGSDLAKSIQSLGSFKSPLAGMVKKDVAFHGSFHFALPATLHKAFESVLDEAAAKSLEGIQNPMKKKQADTLFKALMPSAKAGEYQIVAAILGPQAERYTFVGALKLKDGTKLGTSVHELLTDALKQIPEAERGKIQLDFDKVGAIKIHRFEVPKNPLLDPLVEEVAGDKYLHLAFRADAVFLALGKESLTTLKAVLAKTDSVASPPLLFDVDITRMAKWLARTPKQKEQAEKLLTDGESSRVRLCIEGGTSLRAALQIRFSALEFLLKLSTDKEK